MDLDNTCFRINEPDVTAEAFDDEVIVINLANGRYHSLRGSGPWLWQALAAGLGRRDAVARLMAGGDASPDAATQLGVFIDQLTAEGLLVAADDRAGADLPPFEAEPPAGVLTPLIETFTDMENLLAIDPIHEVDVQGWPHTPKPA